MILGGIDEAGLGPALGPLCVAASAFRVPDEFSAETLWQSLQLAVAEKGGRKESRLVVADSKVAHRSGGVAGLELTVLSFLLQHPLCEFIPEGRDWLLSLVECGVTSELLSVYPWYKNQEWEVPGYADKGAVVESAKNLTEAFVQSEVALCLFRCNVVTAGKLNGRFVDGFNKSEALLLETGEHLRCLSWNFPDEEVRIIVDKQGGRNLYLPFLMDIFPGAWIDTVVEGAELSEYELRREGPSVNIRFMPKADRNAFSVALSSILAKYLRERFMADLNTFFCSQVDGLKSTAGYHGDAPRFLAAIEPVIKKLGIDKELLVRQR